MLRSYAQEPTEVEGDEDVQAAVNTALYDAMDTIQSEMGGWGIVPKEEIQKEFERTR